MGRQAAKRVTEFGPSGAKFAPPLPEQVPTPPKEGVGATEN